MITNKPTNFSRYTVAHALTANDLHLYTPSTMIIILVHGLREGGRPSSIALRNTASKLLISIQARCIL